MDGRAGDRGGEGGLAEEQDLMEIAAWDGAEGFGGAGFGLHGGLSLAGHVLVARSAISASFVFTSVWQWSTKSTASRACH